MENSSQTAFEIEGSTVTLDELINTFKATQAKEKNGSKAKQKRNE